MNDYLFRNVGSKSRLVNRVVNEIQKQILDGNLQPGTMLPPERELTEQLGVSRTALREAVRMLVTKGLLETRPGVGTTVRKLTSDQITEPLSILMSQGEGVNLDHLNQVRQILEVEIARVAAREATPDEITSLQESLGRLKLAREDLAEFNQRDAEFHLALAEATHNPFLPILLNSIRDLLGIVRERVQSYPNLGFEVFPDHEIILKHVEAKDSVAAGEAMFRHLDHARQIQKRILNDQEIRPSAV